MATKSVSGSNRPALSNNLDVERVRKDFPALAQRIHGYPLVYLDNAATTQKPSVVLDRIRRSYIDECANIHRGVYQLSERATAAHEAAREKVRQFLGAENTGEIIFVRGATEGVNLVAQSYGRAHIDAGDEILVTAMEHPAALNEDFNLSTAQSTTVTQLAEAIWRRIKGGCPLALVHDEPFAHDVKRRVPDVDKARRVVGFEAKTSLDDMLNEVIPWINQAVIDGLL